MEDRTRRFRQAAVTYFIYGVIYLTGAIYLGQIERGPEASLWWYVIGAVMAVALPALVWQEFKWVTRILAVLVFVRLIGLLRIALRAGDESVPLPGGGDIATVHGAIVFMLVAGVTCFFLARAGWHRSASPE